MVDTKEIANFLDGEKIKIIPAKRSKKLLVFEYLASKFEVGKLYSEKEVNELIDRYQIPSDHATLRRELYDNYLLDRDSFGVGYRRTVKC